MAPSWALMGSVCSRSQLNPRAAINSNSSVEREGMRLSRAPGEDPETLCIPSRQLGWLEMVLSPGDHCHFLLIRGGSVQPSQPCTDTFSTSVTPKSRLETLRTVPHLPWKISCGVMQRSGYQGVDGLDPLGPSLPLSCAPAQGLSRWKQPKNSEFLVHLEFSAPAAKNGEFLLHLPED